MEVDAVVVAAVMSMAFCADCAHSGTLHRNAHRMSVDVREACIELFSVLLPDVC